jgi:hypothetical protein
MAFPVLECIFPSFLPCSINGLSTGSSEQAMASSESQALRENFEIIHNFFQALFPTPSSFELPVNQRNPWTRLPPGWTKPTTSSPSTEQSTLEQSTSSGSQGAHWIERVASPGLVVGFVGASFVLRLYKANKMRCERRAQRRIVKPTHQV